MNVSLNKQYGRDSIPTFLVKQVSVTILTILTTLVNLFLSTGTFPIHFKQSFVTPLLKKPSLDKDTLNNYCPISNLSLISKITEQTVKSSLNERLSSNTLCNPNQFAYTNITQLKLVFCPYMTISLQQ